MAAALQGGRSWWVAPSYKVANVGWRLVKMLGQQVPGAQVSLVDRLISLPGGGEVQVRSADNPDSLRGEGLNFVVLDECAFIAEAAWQDALRPALSDRKGGALFISTPKGQNWFWRLWVRGQEETERDWQSWRFPSVTNPYLDPAEIQSAAAELPERVYQQEYLAEFLTESGGVFRGVLEAIDKIRTQNEDPQPNRRYRLGVDIARVEDFTVLSVTDDTGRQVYFERFNQISWERQLAAIERVANLYRATVVLDCTGVGDPIYEACRKRGLSVVPFTFTNATKEALIDNLAMEIEQGALRLMDVPAQTNELLAYQYELTPSRNVRMNAPTGMHDDTVIALGLSRHRVPPEPSGFSQSDRRGKIVLTRPHR